jgi:hypothetical protein
MGGCFSVMGGCFSVREYGGFGALRQGLFCAAHKKYSH